MADITRTIKKKDINSELPKEFIFICFASFEERSTTIPFSIEQDRIYKSIVFKGMDSYINEMNSVIKKYADMMCKQIRNSTLIELNLENPIQIAEKLTDTVKNLTCLEKTSLVIDITTFTHETLLILLKLIYVHKNKFTSIYCLYNGAEKYSIGDEPENVWLSKGCRDVRNVIGYPGIIRPAAKTCLIILTGFELERATRLIERIEPDRLMLGNGIDSTHENHTDVIRYFFGKFSQWKNDYRNMNSSEFSFSCKYVEHCINDITKITNENPNENYLIVPLNTKISTIATAHVAIQNSSIQVCYSIPETYNFRYYSSPGENITVITMKNIQDYN